MGEALLSGLLRAGVANSDLLIADRRIERSAEITEKFGVHNGTNQEVASKAETVVLVVKPQDMATVLGEIKDAIQPGALVISLAAGITTSFIENLLPTGTPVVRVMPNTPALVDQGMAAINCRNSSAQRGARCSGTGKVSRRRHCNIWLWTGLHFLCG